MRVTGAKGYTVVETLIFLAVSGLMFVLAATFITGKQAKAEFKQSMNNINSQVSGYINDVGNGFYDSAGNFSCAANSVDGELSFPGGTTAVGENTGCVFLGKVINFAPGGDKAKYRVYTVAGRQFQFDPTRPDSREIASNLDESKPKVVNILTQTLDLPGGMAVRKVTNGGNVDGIGFFKIKEEEGVAGITGSGDLNSSDSAMVHDIEALHGQLPNPNAIICFDSGNGQFGVLRIGGGGQRLATTVHIYNDVPAGC